MIQSNIGIYLKQLVVNQGFTIKEFASEFGTTEGYMGEIFKKEDVSTSVIRQVERVLNTSFTLSSELDHTLNEDYIKEGRVINEKKKSGRPVSFGTRDLDKKDVEIYQKEIEGLKEQLRLKDEIISGKDKYIALLEKP
jgi:transcriptional regulator with XRE-family HTH domain